jgi:lipoyl(octanoyl) transferase
VLLLEHPPVFTCGKRTDPHERPLDPGGAEVLDVDRGGKITFHGPGQLVGYPIVRLPDHVRVVDYVRRVEEALIRACHDLGVETARVPGRTGVWLRADATRPERKIAALGIRVSRGVTMHGFALNCDVDLGWFDRFVPCGISDAGVTSLSAELGRDVRVAEVLPVVERHLDELLAWAPYDATPDYEPRPEPGHLRVPVLNPLA